jgi:hypothetical protein
MMQGRFPHALRTPSQAASCLLGHRGRDTAPRQLQSPDDPRQGNLAPPSHSPTLGSAGRVRTNFSLAIFGPRAVFSRFFWGTRLFSLENLSQGAVFSRNLLGMSSFSLGFTAGRYQSLRRAQPLQRPSSSLRSYDSAAQAQVHAGLAHHTKPRSQGRPLSA